ncbi:MAG: hypothetical protein HZC41_23630 [Chloroflexi bacterium]|nr:hypothetical protein [Chloroflexota bacterium]
MDDERYQAARRRVIGRLFWRLTFFLDLIFFLLLMYVLWLSVGRTPESEDNLGALFATFIFGSGLLVHGALAFNVFGRLIDRATRRELERDQPEEKPKRKRLQLADDGEVVALVDDESESQESRYAR